MAMNILETANAIAARQGINKCPDCDPRGIGEICISCKWLRLQSQIAYDNRVFEGWNEVGTRRIWQAVIQQAVQDYTAVSTGLEEERDRDSAGYFLFNDNRTLKTICRLAGFDMDWIQRNTRSLGRISYAGRNARRGWDG
jgi:hypothetical protein